MHAFPATVRSGATLLRLAVASVFVIHGAARAWAGGVVPFGGFLGSVGIPAGTAIAWTLTTIEIAGGLALAAGLLVRPLAVWFGAEMAAGIVLVHAEHGWFTVGLGRNGAEYSVLILACLLAVALTDPRRLTASEAALYAHGRPFLSFVVGLAGATATMALVAVHVQRAALQPRAPVVRERPRTFRPPAPREVDERTAVLRHIAPLCGTSARVERATAGIWRAVCPSGVGMGFDFGPDGSLHRTWRLRGYLVGPVPERGT